MNLNRTIELAKHDKEFYWWADGKVESGRIRGIQFEHTAEPTLVTMLVISGKQENGKPAFPKRIQIGIDYLFGSVTDVLEYEENLLKIAIALEKEKRETV